MGSVLYPHHAKSCLHGYRDRACLPSSKDSLQLARAHVPMTGHAPGYGRRSQPAAMRFGRAGRAVEKRGLTSDHLKP